MVRYLSFFDNEEAMNQLRYLLLAMLVAWGCASTTDMTSGATPVPAERAFAGASCENNGQVGGVCDRGGYRPSRFECAFNTWRCVPDTTRSCPASAEPVECVRGDFLGDCTYPVRCPGGEPIPSAYECIGGRRVCMPVGDCPRGEPDAGMPPPGDGGTDAADSATDAVTFDPTVRQLTTNLCEQPRECTSGNEAIVTTSCGSAQPWEEAGYHLAFTFPRPTSGTIFVAPRLSAGDPRDGFLVRAYFNGETTLAIERAMSVDEIQSGFEVPASTSGGIVLNFQPLGISLYSQALQWDFPPGSIRDGRGGRALSSCLQVGPFVTIPAHGFLRLRETVGQRLECAGTVLRADAPRGVMEGWVMEVGSAELVYVSFPPGPGGARRIYYFRAREAIDWIPSSFDQQTLCARALIVPTGSLAPLLGTGVRQDIGVRPGVSVRWTDAMGALHQGVADRQFTIVERPMLADGRAICSVYDSFRGIVPRRDCEVDITPYLTDYTIRSGVGVTINPNGLFLAARINEYRD